MIKQLRANIESNSKAVIIAATIAFIYGITTWFLPVILDLETFDNLASEDDVIEWMTTLFFFTASVAWFISFVLSKSDRKLFGYNVKYNIFFLGLSFVFLFGVGEEISWGQRILGLETPDALKENMQGELNLHNMPLFQDGALQMTRVFSLFWLTLCIAIPLSALMSDRIKALLTQLNFPIIPLILGFQFLLFYILSKVYAPLGYYSSDIKEVRESQHALLFALIAIVFLIDQLRTRGNSDT
jgi:hypothetical protein